MSKSDDKEKRRKLGRGLGSLIGEARQISIEPPERSRGVPEEDPSAHSGRGSAEAVIHYLSPEELAPNQFQPRTEFDEAAMQSLAESIKRAGIMQPIVARRQGNEAFEIIAGERRWRAAKLLGLKNLPVVIRNVDDQTATELALIENIQREDLNPMERAKAFAVLAGQFGLSHNEIAQRVGLDRTTVTNFLRLNELDPKTAGALQADRISMGHARSLLALTNIDERLRMLQQVERFGMSVRELERRVRAILRPAAQPSSPPTADVTQNAHVRDLAQRIGDHLGTKVAIYEDNRPGTGRMVISFYSLEQFDGLLQRLGFTEQS